MSRFCSNLGLPKQVQMAATYIARKAVELDLVPGRSPISVAAAAIYMASQASAEKKTQKGKEKQSTDVMVLCWCPWYNLFSPRAEIGDIAGVADVTIRQSYRLIYPRAADLFPPDFKFDTPVDKLPQLWTPMCPMPTALCTFRIFALFSLKFALKAQAFWKDNGRIRQSAEDTFQG